MTGSFSDEDLQPCMVSKQSGRFTCQGNWVEIPGISLVHKMSPKEPSHTLHRQVYKASETSAQDVRGDGRMHGPRKKEEE